MAPSSPNVTAPSSASTLPTTHTTNATPTSLPDCRSTAPGTVKMPEPIVVPTTMKTRSRSVRTRARSRVVGASSELAGKGLRDLARRRLAADIGRTHTGGERLLHRALEVAGRLRMTQLLEHQSAREHRGHRVRDALARERRSRAVHRLEQSRPARMKIRAGGEPEPADQARPQVREDIAVQVVGDDDLKPLGLAHQLHRERVHVAVLGVDACELSGDAPEGLLPDAVRWHGVRLVAHGHPGLAVRSGPLEGRADDPIDASRGVDLLGDIRLPLSAALPGVDSLRVLPEDREVDHLARPQRGQVGMQQTHRPEVDVEVQLEPQTEQDVTGVFVTRHSGIADRAEEDGVDVV